MNILFIPGLACTSKVWGELNQLRCDYSCTDAKVSDANTMEGLADLVEQQIDPTQLYTVIGISMGGYIALELAFRKHPWLQKLVLINTTADAVDPKTIPNRLKKIELAKKNQLDRLLALSAGFYFYEKKPEYLTIEREMAYEVGCKAFITQQMAIINRKSYKNNIHEITQETLVISSKHDPLLDYHDAYFLFDQIRNAQLTVFSNAGHLTTLEKGKEVYHTVLNFLGKTTF